MVSFWNIYSKEKEIKKKGAKEMLLQTIKTHQLVQIIIRNVRQQQISESKTRATQNSS